MDGDKADVVPVVENAFVGLMLPRGHHDIILKYVAPGRYVGRNISIATGLVLCVVSAKFSSGTRCRTINYRYKGFRPL